MGPGTVLQAQSSVLVCSPHLPVPPPYSAAPTPQCEEIKATMQRDTQSLRHSKEEMNRLNQAIQKLTADVDSAKSQVRDGNEGWQSSDGQGMSILYDNQTRAPPPHALG